MDMVHMYCGGFLGLCLGLQCDDVCRAHQLFAGAALLQRYAFFSIACMHQGMASKDKVLRAPYHALSRPSPLRPARVMPCPFRELPYPDQLCLS